jgi:TonB family protein
MSEEKKYPSFSAADIEKYHKGQLSTKEMHDLEKAALDDAFLADAVEGYATAGVNANADIEDLKKRLAAKQQTGKVVPITAGRRSNSTWIRAAVMIIAIAGAGLLVYQFAFNTQSDKNIAKTDQKTIEEIKPADSNLAVSPTVADSTSIKAANISKKTENAVAGNEQSKQVVIVKQNNGRAAFMADSIKYNFSTADKLNASSAPVNFSKDSASSNKNNVANDVYAKKSLRNDKAADLKKESNADGVIDRLEQQKEGGNSNVSRSVTLNNRAQNERNNYFRGRIIDPNNNPVPFANVTNTQDNVGTYSDAKGYFNLVSPDSILDVQIRSIGFDNNRVQLRGDVINNEVVMQEDRNSLAEVVISNKKPNATSRARDTNMKLEEPEPADGWDNYDTYLVNNLNVPNEIKTKQRSGNVEVSFEVDKNGEPINIKVERSLCKKCDQEAIRLIKEGPKWKRKVKKGRATVTVPF